MIKEAGVTVFLDHRLREKNGVEKSGTRVTSIVMENGARFSATIFADASYEGDLMAQAGVSYTWGREAITAFNESLAGVREQTPLHQFRAAVSPYDAVTPAAARGHAADPRTRSAQRTSASRPTTSACA